MQIDLLRKDDQPSTSVAKRSKPTLITLDNGRQIVSSGRWNNDLMADYVLLNGRDNWLSIGELSRTAFGNASPRMKRRARQCIANLSNHFLNKGFLLIVEYGGGWNSATAVKLYNPGTATEADKQAAFEKLKKMRSRRVISEERYEKAILVIQDGQMGSQ